MICEYLEREVVITGRDTAHQKQVTLDSQPCLGRVSTDKGVTVVNYEPPSTFTYVISQQPETNIATVLIVWTGRERPYVDQGSGE